MALHVGETSRASAGPSRHPRALCIPQTCGSPEADTMFHAKGFYVGGDLGQHEGDGPVTISDDKLHFWGKQMTIMIKRLHFDSACIYKKAD